MWNRERDGTLLNIMTKVTTSASRRLLNERLDIALEKPPLVSNIPPFLHSIISYLPVISQENLTSTEPRKGNRYQIVKPQEQVVLSSTAEFWKELTSTFLLLFPEPGELCFYPKPPFTCWRGTQHHQRERQRP